MLYSAKDKMMCGLVYELSGGRFGDQLICYFHAKWVSYCYDIPVLYKPFSYSHELILHDQEVRYSNQLVKRIPFKKVLKSNETLDHFVRSKNLPCLYTIPYFPESIWEHRNHNTHNHWPYFAVDWEDKGFRKLLQKLVYPKRQLQLLQLPEDKLTVCIHIRRGKEYDGPGMEHYYPLKFPPDDFYMNSLCLIVNMFPNTPLYVHLFTDDSNNKEVLSRFRQAFQGFDIEFHTRENGNVHNANVLEDFFSMMRFDCIIHGESNFSLCAALIGDYLVRIRPQGFHWENKQLIIDTFHIQKDEELIDKKIV